MGNTKCLIAGQKYNFFAKKEIQWPQYLNGTRITWIGRVFADLLLSAKIRPIRVIRVPF
jgi:hypothetical protein